MAVRIGTSGGCAGCELKTLRKNIDVPSRPRCGPGGPRVCALWVGTSDWLRDCVSVRVQSVGRIGHGLRLCRNAVEITQTHTQGHTFTFTHTR